jgi:hypothetical protein
MHTDGGHRAIYSAQHANVKARIEKQKNSRRCIKRIRPRFTQKKAPMPKYNQSSPEQARAAAFNPQHKAYNTNTAPAPQTTAGKTGK